MPLSTARFLVVDSFSTMRRIVYNLLQDSGFVDIEEAEDGNIALHKLRNSRFDFVICDVQLPTLGGLELLAAMKANESLRHIPVLLVTAEARRADILQAGKLGAAGYVVKPFTKAVLEDKVIHILRRMGLD